jgi:hypothetical protein
MDVMRNLDYRIKGVIVKGYEVIQAGERFSFSPLQMELPAKWSRFFLPEKPARQKI